MRPLFLLRWAARDLRQRWLQVAAIAVVIAIGTGVYSALGSTGEWRRQSNDASFARLAMYDLRVRAADGASAATGEMAAIVRSLPDPGRITAAEERLVVATQVDASRDGRTILVPGRIVGVDVRGGGPHVNRVFVDETDGRTLHESDATRTVAVLDAHFASFYDLPVTGEVTVSGGSAVPYVGLGLSPEYFFIMTEEGGLFAEANFAVLFMPLDAAGEATGNAGRVDDLVLTAAPGTDLVALAADVEAAFDASGLGLGVTVTGRAEEDAYRILYDDIEGDERFWTVFAGLILAGAAFGAFNLSSRLVEAQRREIGIGMALGAPRRALAARPLLVGAQIAVIGVVVGVAIGLLVAALLRPVYTDVLPLPEWRTDLQIGTFARGAALGFVIPLAATVWPVWRAVRVMPVDAITTTHREARHGASHAVRHLRRPLSVFRRMPIGNVLRAPRRTVLTTLAIGAAVSTLVAILGMVDSFVGTMRRNEREVLQDHPDRVEVGLNAFVLASGPEVEAIRGRSTVANVEPVARVGSALTVDGRRVDVLLHAVDLTNPLWVPTVPDGSLPVGEAGLVIAQKAATDLDVTVGDVVVVEHPTLVDGAFTLVESRMEVAAVHGSPFRFPAFVDRSQLSGLGVPDVANLLYVDPVAGIGADAITRDLFALDGVTSVQPVARGAQLFEDTFDDYTAVFHILEAFILVLALLIAYNAARINADERAKERATLFAFGFTVRRVVTLEVAEALIVGVASTVVGVAGGHLIVRWFATSIATTTIPDISLDVVVTWSTIWTAVILGVVAVASAPLLTIGRMRRMNVAGTLRIVE